MTDREAKPSGEDWERACQSIRDEANHNIASATGIGGRYIRAHWLQVRSSADMIENEARRIAGEGSKDER